MAALDCLRRAGLEIELVEGALLRVTPADRITEDIRQFVRDHRAQLLAELSAANEVASPPWLHLLVLADGHAIQRCGELITATVEREARLQFGRDLLTVIAVAGVDRPLTEVEIVKALAGALVVPFPPPPPSGTWLAHVAGLLGTHPVELLKLRHLELHDLAELAGTDPVQVVATIRSSPAWIDQSLGR